MATGPARLLIGATLLVAGFGVMSDGAPLRLLDFKERECRNASVAVGSACPAGCVARPFRAPADRALPTECRSPIWIATCGHDCGPSDGFVRVEGGHLADAHRLVVALSDRPTVEFERALAKDRLVAEPRFDGLYRYEIVLPRDDAPDLEETKKRLAALPGVTSVGYVLR
jgi:hypothetical protein